MRVPRSAILAGLSAVLLSGLSACDALAPATGAVRVTAPTSGVDIDADGYDLRVDGALAGELEAQGTLIVTGLRPGGRLVRLERLALNCASPNAGARTVTVVADDTVDA